MKKDRVGKIEDILCTKCGVTKHTIRGAFDGYWDDGNDGGVSAGAANDLLECNGCQRATLRVTSWCSEDMGDPGVDLWPPRKKDSPLRQPRSFANLEWGSPVESVYRQTMAAFNHELSTLAGAGVRLLIEGVCLDQGITGGRIYTDQGKLVRDKKTGKVLFRDSLDGKINGLSAKGHISKKQVAVLHQIRKLGNDAAHALDQTSMKLVEDSINVIEHLFEQIYEQKDVLARFINRKKPTKKK